jgi:hypothetical protein
VKREDSTQDLLPKWFNAIPAKVPVRLSAGIDHFILKFL